MALSISLLGGFGRIASEGDYSIEPITPGGTRPDPMEPVFVDPAPPPPSKEPAVYPSISPAMDIPQRMPTEPSPYPPLEPIPGMIDPIYATSVMQPYTPYPPLEPPPMPQPQPVPPPSMPYPTTPPGPMPPPFEQPTAGAHVEPSAPMGPPSAALPALFVLPNAAKWGIGIGVVLLAALVIRRLMH